MKNLKILTLCTILALAVAAPAFAKGGHGSKHEWKEQETHQEHERKGDDDHIALSLRFDDGHRDRTRTYLREHYRHDCPPGLAKKHNGCQPPGQAKKYAIGGYAPHDHHPVPSDLLELLGPPPHGAYYAMVDKDVLLISEATKKILDAVTLMSAME